MRILLVCALLLPILLVDAQTRIPDDGASPLWYENTNIGIGTNNPSSKLDVNGNIQISNASIPMGLVSEVGGTTPILNMSLNFRESNKNTSYIGAAFRIDTRSTYPLYNWFYRAAGTTSDKTIMSLEKNGRLVVGLDDTPASITLELKGQNPNILLTSKNTSAPYGAIRGNNGLWLFGYAGQSGSENISIGTQSGSGQQTITFAAGGNAKMKLLANGNLGIGTNSPNYKLEVNGTIRSKEVKVEASPWPDFVFTEEHELPDLQEVNTYIQQNGHLPEIPTAKEVEENGVSLGEMNAKLLQKIEELTLYVIEQERKIESYDERFKEQNDRIGELEKIIKKSQ